MKKEIFTIKGALIIFFTIFFSAIAIYLAIGFFSDKEDYYNEKGETTSLVVKGKEKDLIESNNRFAFDLYKELSGKENVFFSPYSIFSAMAMAYEGATEETEEEIARVFYFPKKEELRGAFKNVYNIINAKRDEGQLNTGNALWVHLDYPFLESYKENVENYYAGEVVNLDFLRRTEISRKTINDYIEEQTNNKIVDLIPNGALDPLTKLVITNAIYFQGDWRWSFDKNKTHQADFYNSEGKKSVEMMALESSELEFNYFKNEDVEMIELPYGEGGDISMFIVLPKEEEWLKEELTFESFNYYKDEMISTRLDAVFLPKFEFETKYFMKNTLSSMGMRSAFFPGSANFSLMDGTKNLFIEDVIHQAFIGVDEEGTEAAAATAIMIRVESVPAERLVFRADRPFAFLITENETGKIIFFGKVVNPQ